MSSLNDIVVNISGGTLSGDVLSNRFLLVSDGATEIGPVIINQADYVNELAVAGVSSTEKLYKMVEQYFTPDPLVNQTPSDVAIYRKQTATAYVDALNALTGGYLTPYPPLRRGEGEQPSPSLPVSGREGGRGMREVRSSTLHRGTERGREGEE